MQAFRQFSDIFNLQNYFSALGSLLKSLSPFLWGLSEHWSLMQLFASTGLFLNLYFSFRKFRFKHLAQGRRLLMGPIFIIVLLRNKHTCRYLGTLSFVEGYLHLSFEILFILYLGQFSGS